MGNELTKPTSGRLWELNGISMGSLHRRIMGYITNGRIMGYMNDIINTMVYIWVCLQVDEPIAIVVVIVI